MLKAKRRNGFRSAKKKMSKLFFSKQNLMILSSTREICGIPEDEDEDLEDTII